MKAIHRLIGCGAAGWMLSLAPAKAQEVFREFTPHHGAGPEVHFGELDPGTKRKSPAASRPRHVPKPVTLDLAEATRAELSFEYWGGHIGTSGQRFQINGGGWVDLPQPAGTPGDPHVFHRTLLGNNAVAVPLAQLREGENSVQFAAGPQIAFSFDWGFYWIYDFTVRVFYAPVRPHPTGEIVVPAGNDGFDDALAVEARAASPNGDISRVEYLADCDDFDWDGDGVWREWQFTTHHGVLQHHVGTASAAPWRVIWDTRWLPDQTHPVRLRARITDSTGITYLTPPVEVRQQRINRGVRMFKSGDVPEYFSARMSHEKQCSIDLPDDLSGVKAAQLLVSTWSGSTDDDSVHELRLNGERLANRFGQFENYGFNRIEVPVARLRPGRNEVTVYSTFKGHALEINWPGPVLLVEF